MCTEKMKIEWARLYEGDRVVGRERGKERKDGENARCEDVTKTLLHTGAFTHRRSCAETFMHTDAFTYTDAFTHRRFYTLDKNGSLYDPAGTES